MVDITSNGVSFAVLGGQLLAGEIDRSAFLERVSPLGIEASEAAAIADKFLAIAFNQAARQKNLKSSYDYIVVGSGAAGSVVARRLAENLKNQVLLLEASDSDLKPNVLITENWFFNQGGSMDWSFAAEPSPAVNNRSIHQAMGKALGGGTSINGMVWAPATGTISSAGRKNRETQAGVISTSSKSTSASRTGMVSPIQQAVAREGPVFVQAPPEPGPLAPAFLAAAQSIGFRIFADQNGILREGPGGGALTNLRIRSGRRLNIPADYLYPVMDQPNLTVLTGALVRKLTLDGTSVTGVEFDWRGEVRMIKASSEVVLSAGTIQTPKILMLSGIGDQSELARFGIATVAHLPGVGRNLQDHPIIGACLWEPPPNGIPARANAAEANLFVKSDPGLDTPDLHIWNTEAPYVSEVTIKCATPNAWSINPGLVRPCSRGYLRLKSVNPADAPEVHANMLGDPLDLAALRKGMEISRELGNSAAMKPFVKREILPGDVQGEALDNLIRDGALSMHHVAGTARMEQDELSAVDANLRVYGVKNLRIADGSIMPTITTGNGRRPA